MAIAVTVSTKKQVSFFPNQGTQTCFPCVVLFFIILFFSFKPPTMAAEIKVPIPNKKRKTYFDIADNGDGTVAITDTRKKRRKGVPRILECSYNFKLHFQDRMGTTFRVRPAANQLVVTFTKCLPCPIPTITARYPGNEHIPPGTTITSPGEESAWFGGRSINKTLGCHLLCPFKDLKYGGGVLEITGSFVIHLDVLQRPLSHVICDNVLSIIRSYVDYDDSKHAPPINAIANAPTDAEQAELIKARELPYVSDPPTTANDAQWATICKDETLRISDPKIFSRFYRGKSQKHLVAKQVNGLFWHEHWGGFVQSFWSEKWEKSDKKEELQTLKKSKFEAYAANFQVFAPLATVIRCFDNRHRWTVYVTASKFPDFLFSCVIEVQ
jgi:hypothetical protein